MGRQQLIIPGDLPISPQQLQKIEAEVQKLSSQQQKLLALKIQAMFQYPPMCSKFAVDDPIIESILSAVLDDLRKAKMPGDDMIAVKKFLSKCGSKQKEFLKVECDRYMETPSFKDGKDKDTIGYVGCCKELKFCSGPFYTQIWFFAVCGGVALLLIGIIGVVVFLVCRRKKRGEGSSGGGGMKSSKKSTKKSKK
ncbi:hypothetical protein B9Z55_008030 [Caenorhabditis nigoni]|nr:hypothetical protein B9Z55_008030 [Caenorhabditis nigoni]